MRCYQKRSYKYRELIGHHEPSLFTRHMLLTCRVVTFQLLAPYMMVIREDTAHSNELHSLEGNGPTNNNIFPKHVITIKQLYTEMFHLVSFMKLCAHT